MVAVFLSIFDIDSETQMRVVTLISGLNNGGAEKLAVELCNELSGMNEVYILVKSPINESMLPPKKINDKVNIVAFNTSSRWSVIFFIRLFFVVRKLKPDIIHVHSSLLIFYTFFYGFAIKKCKVFHTIHSQVTPPYMKLFRFLRRIKWLGRRINHVVISKKIHDDFKNVFPMFDYTIIENGVAPLTGEKERNLNAKNGRIRLLAIGNYSTVKRFDLLAEVMVSPEIEPFYTLQILGQEKDPEQKVTNYIRSLNAVNIELLGLQENVGCYLRNADALVIWSSYEGMPLAMLESLSMSCPVIASPVGGIIDVLGSGEFGIVTKGLDQEDLIDALIQFKRMSAIEMTLMREKCLNHYRNFFHISICARKYKELFEFSV